MPSSTRMAGERENQINLLWRWLEDDRSDEDTAEDPETDVSDQPWLHPDQILLLICQLKTFVCSLHLKSQEQHRMIGNISYASLSISLCMSHSVSPSACLILYLTLHVSIFISLCMSHSVSNSACLTLYLTLHVSLCISLCMYHSVSHSACLTLYLTLHVSLCISLSMFHSLSHSVSYSACLTLSPDGPSHPLSLCINRILLVFSSSNMISPIFIYC